MQPMFAFIVLGLAIVAFFSQECIRVCKKITSIPGAKLLLPLAFASWMLEEYEDWGGWLLVKFQAVLHQTIHFFSTLLPFEFERGKISLIRIIFLFLLACLPVWLPVWLHRLKAIRSGQRNPETITYRVGLLLWIIAVIMLTVY